MTEKQKIFVDEYLIDLNATRAYKTAYPHVKNDNSAAAGASRMLRNVKVEKYIEERMKEREKRTEITQDMVLKELAAIAFSNATDCMRVVMKQASSVSDGNLIQLFDEKGNPIMVPSTEIVPTDQLTEEQKKAIASIKDGTNGVEIKMYSKEKALELLGRHLGMWNDKLAVEGAIKLEDLL